MKRRHFYVGLSCALCALTLAPTATAFAGGKGKSDRIRFAPNNGGGGGGGNSTPMKLHSSQSLNMSTSTLGSSASSNWFNKSLSTKSNKSFSELNSNGMTLQKFNSFGSTNKLSLAGKSLVGEQPYAPGRHAPQPRLTLGGTKLLSDAIKPNGTSPLDPGIGNGTGGGGMLKWKGKLIDGDAKQLIDSIDNHKFFPVGGNGGNAPGEGNGGPDNGNGNGPGKGDHGDHDNHDCHDNDKCHDHCDFPWWPIIVGGCYHGGCYDGCYDNYNGGCYNQVISYPVTNVTVVEPPAQPILAAGVDLELLDVRLVDEGDAARNLGPRYRLTFGNRGTDPAGNFQVMLMATADGTPKQGAPMATAELGGLASRQVLSADVRLPLSADLATLEKFIVVVDSAAQIAEADENNNVALLERAKIATIELAALSAP